MVNHIYADKFKINSAKIRYSLNKTIRSHPNNKTTTNIFIKRLNSLEREYDFYVGGDEKKEANMLQRLDDLKASINLYIIRLDFHNSKDKSEV